MRIHIADFTVYSDKEGKAAFFRCFVTWEGMGAIDTNMIALAGPIKDILGRKKATDELREDCSRTIHVRFEADEFLPLALAIAMEILPETAPVPGS